ASPCRINQITIVRNSSGNARTSTIVTPACSPVEGSDCSSLIVSPRRLHPRLSSRSDVAPVLLLHRSCSPHRSRIHDLSSDRVHSPAIGMSRRGNAEQVCAPEFDHFFRNG